MTVYALPDLRYDYSALEPHLSAGILELHHDRHHRTYVDGANRALEGLHEARDRKETGRIGALERALAFHLSGHVLHSLFWRNLSPSGGGRPTGDLLDAIERDFGGFDPFRAQMIESAASIHGSGWSALALEPLTGRLLVEQIHDHQSDAIQGAVPLLVLDAWEHAYYLQYGSDKRRYFEAIWNVFDWEDVAGRFASVSAHDLWVPGAVAGIEAPAAPV